MRESKGKTIEYVAFRSGPSYATVSNLERGLNNVSIASLYAIADCLKIDINELIV